MTLGKAISSTMQREGMTQDKVAKEAGVSQSTVSRRARWEPRRRSAAQARLHVAMHHHAIDSERPAEVLDALQEIWDGSAAHAKALASLLRASGELWPDLKPEEPDHKR
jgi:transcriptional regulator with XRE-family HTH domain